MPCEHVTLPNGGRAIVCHSHKPQRCACGRIATLACDWKKQVGACDRPLCDRCTTSPAPEKDLCPAHARAFEEWKSSRSARQQVAS